MKYHALFYQKTMKKYLRLSSAAVLIGALRVKGQRMILAPNAKTVLLLTYNYILTFTSKSSIKSINSSHMKAHKTDLPLL